MLRSQCTFSLLGAILLGAGVFPYLNAQKAAGKPDSTKTAMSLHLEIITPHEGTELDDLGNRLTKSVWHNWLVLMPESAMLGDKGQATIRFRIDKGSLHPARAATIKLSSGKKPLEAAALRAVHDSIKSRYLSHSVAASSIEFGVLFFYNQQPAKLRGQ
jgi:hypothetical protein